NCRLRLTPPLRLRKALPQPAKPNRKHPDQKCRSESLDNFRFGRRRRPVLQMHLIQQRSSVSRILEAISRKRRRKTVVNLTETRKKTYQKKWRIQPLRYRTDGTPHASA